MLIRVGTSGWSYPSWRPGFYPAGLDPSKFLGFYAERFPTVELNTTGYRLPAEDQFRRWAEQAPGGIRVRAQAAGAAPARPGRLRVARARARRPARAGAHLAQVARDEGALELLLGSLDPSLRLAFDLEHPSWDGIEERLAAAGAVRVNDLDHPAPFRYLRLREPPYGDAALRGLADRLRGLAEPAYAYFRHEDEPTAPVYAQRLLELL